MPPTREGWRLHPSGLPCVLGGFPWFFLFLVQLLLTPAWTQTLTLFLAHSPSLSCVGRTWSALVGGAALFLLFCDLLI